MPDIVYICEYYNLEYELCSFGRDYYGPWIIITEKDTYERLNINKFCIFGEYDVYHMDDDVTKECYGRGLLHDLYGSLS